MRMRPRQVHRHACARKSESALSKVALVRAAGEEADEDPLAVALTQERSHAAHTRSADLGAAIDPDGGVSDDSRRFSYYALEGATGAVRWRHDVHTVSQARALSGVDGILLAPLQYFFFAHYYLSTGIFFHAAGRDKLMK